jgi:predicted Zn-dependent protease
VSRAIPVALAAFAAVVAAWFAMGIRQAHDTDAATAILSANPRLTAAQARHATDLLQAARFLNPDRQVAVLRAQVDAARGDLRGARRILKRVVASEPDNLVAWIALARASVGDLKDFYAAAYRIRQLVPPVPPPP